MTNGRKLFAAAITLAAVVAVAFFIVNADDPLRYDEVSFDHAGGRLSGLLVRPVNHTGALPCIVFVHGDGPMERDAFDYYKAYWRQFASDGFCSLSWDKPGTGNSTGNWLRQSMDDRAAEVASAIRFLRARADVDPDRIGLIGFSQAGWVLPKVATADPALAFMIVVGGAIDWMEQSAFNMERRLVADGIGPTDAARERACAAMVNDALRANASYEAYLALYGRNGEDCGDEPIDADRWRFISLNWHSNARVDLRRINLPVLAVFGDKDAYVDVGNSIETYQADLGAKVTIRLFPNADHGLMKASEAKPDHSGIAGIMKIARIEFLGDAAFAEGYFKFLSRWLGALPQK